MQIIYYYFYDIPAKDAYPKRKHQIERKHQTNPKWKTV